MFDQDKDIREAEYKRGLQAGLLMAAHRLETANDETSRQCIAEAMRKLAASISIGSRRDRESS